MSSVIWLRDNSDMRHTTEDIRLLTSLFVYILLNREVLKQPHISKPLTYLPILVL